MRDEGKEGKEEEIMREERKQADNYVVLSEGERESGRGSRGRPGIASLNGKRGE